jgi:acetyl esterase
MSMTHELLEPFTRAWLARELAVEGPALTSLPIEEARLLMRQGQGETPTDERLVIRRLHSPEMDFYLLRPAGEVGELPVLVYLHGGGWVLGDFETHKRLVQELTLAVGCAVVFPEYPLAPEAPFPAALEATYAFLRWIVLHGPMLKLDIRRMALAGDSSGGNLASVLAVLAAQRRGPAVCFQALLYPVMGCDFTLESYSQFGSGFFLDASLMEWFWHQYVPNQEDRRNPRACPLLAPVEALAGAAPALVITAECDILRDEGEAYARRLAEAGVPTTAWRALGTVHSFLLANGLARSAPAMSAFHLLTSQLKTALRGASLFAGERSEQ